jgi:hypothetical protein
MKNSVIIVACGVGRDSVGMLCRMRQLKIRPNHILFANVGSEKSGTYEFIPHLQAWLACVGFPPLTIVQYKPRLAPYTTIEGNMVANATLPGATFGRGSCTVKWKIVPQNKWCNQDPLCQATWAKGEKVFKLIGFECTEGYRQSRAADKAHAGKGSPDADKYTWLYPLMEWGWDLERCKQAIADEGMPIPPKSACFFCPNMQPREVHDLSDEERARVIRMELTAEPFNRKVHGLWRRPRKKAELPGSITEYILKQGLPFIPLEELEDIPINPACQKAEAGCTFHPPHNSPTLWSQLADAGHLPADETEQHLDIVEEL